MLAALLISFFLGASGVSGAILTHGMLKDFDESAQKAISDRARAGLVSAEVAVLDTEQKVKQAQHQSVAEANQTIEASAEDIGNFKIAFSACV